MTDLTIGHGTPLPGAPPRTVWAPPQPAAPVPRTPRAPRLVILESPYAGNVERNVAYARACLGDCVRRGESPLASHLLFTQPGVLNDAIPEERRLGVEAGLAWGRVADAAVFYIDLGWSGGMIAARSRHLEAGLFCEFRSLPGWFQ